MATTAVIRMQKLNFKDKVNADGKTMKGGAAGLWAIKYHNERKELDNIYECKTKQGTHIDKDRSKDNIYIKRISAKDIDEIKEQGKDARSNASCAFEIVIDFQDLTDEEKENWDPIYHTKMIQKYFQSIGLSDKFKMIGMAIHLDELNPHIHCMFSGYSQSLNKFNINNHFNPEIGDPILDKHGDVVYKRYNRGKLKGQYMLDDEHNKIVKRQALNGGDYIQATWGLFLEENAPQYRNDKEFTSFFFYPDNVFHKFSEEQKSRIYRVREAERDYHHLKRDGFEDEAETIKSFILNEFADLNGYALDKAQELFATKQIERKQKQNLYKTLAPKLY